MIVRLRAPAKINLGLEILGRRSDGYHEVRTILAAVSLHDELVAHPNAETSLRVDNPKLGGNRNLVLVAARVLAADHPRASATFDLRKSIPAASGLGGASSDAAAALVALDSLFHLQLPTERLEAYGARVGSDVPFFIRGGIALASGRGERLTRLALGAPASMVIVAPRIAIPAKTATLYGSLTSSDFSDGTTVELTARRGTLPDREQALVNAFERPLYELVPELRDLRSLMKRWGARLTGLSGAGPAHYALVDDDEASRALAERLALELGRRAHVFRCALVPDGVRILEPTGSG